MKEPFDFTKFEQIEYMKSDLKPFFEAMKNKMISKFDEKGRTYIDCNLAYLKNQLRQHVIKQDWIDVANFCFMIWYNQQRRTENVR